MINNGKAKGRYFGIILILFVLFLSSTVGAAEGVETPKKLNLNLESSPTVEEAVESIEKLYQELLDEVHISEEASQVVKSISETISGLQDLSADIEVTQYKGERADKVTGHLMVSAVHKAARLEFNSPSALRGQIILADQGNMEVRVYMPVTNEIVIQSMSDMGEEAAAYINVTDVSTLFDFSQYAVEVLESSTIDEVQHYLLQITGYDDQVQYVRVGSDTWIPYEITVYEDGLLFGELLFINAKLDQSFTEEEIKQLPKAKETRL